LALHMYFFYFFIFFPEPTHIFMSMCFFGFGGRVKCFDWI
jgi:hypothetical protein